MKRIIFLISILSLIALTGCADKDYACSAGDPNIVGAECNDGSYSSATGSGACSHHDGVKSWRCED